MSNHLSLQTLKRQLRDRCVAHRGAVADKQACSRQILQQLRELPEYHAASVISTYISLPPEVQTFEFIHQAWDDGKSISVPCCIGDQLKMFHLESVEDLAAGTLGILEPRIELRQNAQRWLNASEFDLFIVPGIAFDRSGGRVGYGKGYYDRLLANAAHKASKIALAFACQMVDQVPTGPHDIPMDRVVTEQAVYLGNT